MLKVTNYTKRAHIGRPFSTKHYSDMIKMYLLLPNQKLDDKYSSLIMTTNQSPAACHCHHTMNVLHVSFVNFQVFKVS